jgi:hypothetical protein
MISKVGKKYKVYYYNGMKLGFLVPTLDGVIIGRGDRGEL